jgi:hypothetical protein
MNRTSRVHGRFGSIPSSLAVLWVLAAWLPVSSALGQTGTVLSTFHPGPGGPAGAGRALAYDGATTLYYTVTTSNNPSLTDHNIYKVSTAGVFLGAIPLAGRTFLCGALAWDAAGSMLWAGAYDGTGIYTINPTTGVATFRFGPPFAPGESCFNGNPYATIDGLSLDPDDGSLWLSDDAASKLYHVTATGTNLAGSPYTVPNHPVTGTQGWNSGIAALPGCDLELALSTACTTGQSMVVRVKKKSPSGPVIASFVHGVPPGYAQPEGLAFDSNTFAPSCAVWSNDAAGPNNITAYQVDCAGVMCDSVCVLKFDDQNYDGTNNGEPPLAGWSFQINPGGLLSLPTPSNGRVCIGNVAPGSYTLSEITKPGWILTKPAAPGSYSITTPTATTYEFGNHFCADTIDCPQPGGMVSWWPFDESTGPTAHDVVGGKNGTWYGVTPVPGYVGIGLSFVSTTAVYVQVPPASLHNFGTGDFSMDAWVYRYVVDNQPRTLVEKIAIPSGKPTWAGYRFYLNGNQLAFELGDGVKTESFTLPTAMSANQWYHVAAVVSRSGNPTVTLYLNSCSVGGSQQTFSITQVTGSVNNGTSLIIGNALFQPSTNLRGILDEVEIFRKALSASEVGDICKAGSVGKCKKSCFTGRDIPFRPGQSQATLCFTIFNQDWSQPSACFHWTLAPLPANGTSCTTAGPTSFNPTSGTVCVPPTPPWSIPAPICVTVDRPPGLVPGQSACYQVTILDDLTGKCFMCSGRLVATKKHHFAPPSLALIRVPEGGSRLVNFNVVREAGSGSGVLHFRIRATAHDDHPDDLVARLNGLPPGTPVEDSVAMAPGDSVQIGANVSLDPHLIFPPQEIVLDADDDGDGVLEEIVSAGVVGDSAIVVGVEEPGAGTRTDRMIEYPNPFHRAARVLFTLPRADVADVSVYDMAGRRLRVLHSGRLAAGAHELSWDGNDALGKPARTGIYLIRVRSAGVDRTLKVVRVN